MAAGIVVQFVGRRAASQVLSSAVLAYTGTQSARSRIGLSVFAVTAVYYKLRQRGDATALTVSATDAEGMIAAGASDFLPFDYNVEPVFTGTVVASEALGTYD